MSTPEEVPRRQEFVQALEQAGARISAMLVQDPTYHPAVILRRQLDFIATFCKNWLPPTQAERDRITVGVIAIHEFEDPSEFADHLHTIQYGFKFFEHMQP